MSKNADLILTGVIQAIGRELTDQERKHITAFINIALLNAESDGFMDGVKKVFDTIKGKA